MSATAERVISGTEYGPAPDRSLLQRLEALQHANEVRSHRAALKRDVKRGRARVTELLLEPPEDILTMKVFDLLLAAPKVGRVKANKLTSMARISPSKTVGGLTERQRGELAGLLGRRVAPPPPPASLPRVERDYLQEPIL